MKKKKKGIDVKMKELEDKGWFEVRASERIIMYTPFKIRNSQRELCSCSQ